MSKWTEIRDGALDAMKQGALNVAEETKQQFLVNFIEAGVPVVEEYAAQFTAKVKEQATNETGWTKIRDAIVIPFAISAVMWVSKYVIERTLIETEKVQ